MLSKSKLIALLLIHLTALFIQPSAAYPSLFFYRYASTCTSVLVAGHNNNRHGTAVADASKISFLMTEGQTPISTICTGKEYQLKVTFSSSGQGLLVASHGILSGRESTSCPNRVSMDQSGTSYLTTWTLPCSATGASRVTFSAATGSGGTISTNQNAMDVDASCSACAPLVTLTPSSSASPPRVNPYTPPLPPSPPRPPLRSPPPSPSPRSNPPSPPPTPLDEAAAPAVTTSPIDTTAKSGCAPGASNLNYTCRTDQAGLQIHWSVNTTYPPENLCTGSRTGFSEPPNDGSGRLHMAVVGRVQGYLSIAFAARPGAMAPADALLGVVQPDGGGSVRTYHITSGSALDDRHLVRNSWAYNTGAAKTAAGESVLCFSRQLLDARAPTLPHLKVWAAAGAGGGGGGAAGRRHLLQSGPAAVLGYNYAVGGSNALNGHLSSGGFTLDMSSGSATTATSNKQHYINVHGALMSVAWVLLLPLGTMFPAHRWVLRGAMWGSKQAWLYLHIISQVVGMALFITGFVVAKLKFESSTDRVRDAHANLGIAVMAMTGLQMVMGFIRPDPSSPKRKYWNWLHWNWGRFAILAAWANAYLGIYMYHTGIFKASYREWLVPVAVVMGVIVVADIVLRVLAPQVPVPSGKVVPHTPGADTKDADTKQHVYVDGAGSAPGSRDSA